MVLTAKSELQNAADAAAFAAVNRLGYNDYWGAAYQAVTFGSLNTCMGRPLQLYPGDVTFGTYDFNTSSFVAAPPGVPGGSNAIQIRARRVEGAGQGPLQLFFARVLGQDTADVEASTTAAVDRRVTGFNGGIIATALQYLFEEQHGTFLDFTCLRRERAVLLEIDELLQAVQPHQSLSCRVHTGHIVVVPGYIAPLIGGNGALDIC